MKSIALVIIIQCFGATCFAQTIQVPVAGDWFNTGVFISKNRQLHLTAKGMINWYPACKQCTSTPAGTGCPSPAARSKAPLSTANCYGLIGKIGNSKPFVIGTDFNEKVKQEGMLYIRVNDEFVVDNKALDNGDGTEGWQLTIMPLLPEEGDVIVYGHDVHVGVIAKGGIKKNADGTVVITKIVSKWGGGAIYEHDPNEVPPLYGQDWTIYRRNTKQSGCPIEKCNSLLPIKSYDGIRRAVYTDKHRAILVGFIEVADTYKAGETVPGMPSVHRIGISPNTFHVDCRGYVFLEGSSGIQQNDGIFIKNDQLDEILADGYTQVHGYDTQGNLH